MKHILFTIITVSAALLSGAQDNPWHYEFRTRSEIIAKNGMAATSHPLATQVALDILKEGGNAVDAAIAANAVIGLMEPTGNGIGGDLFAIVWDSESKQLHGLNASGRSPEKLTHKYFIENDYDRIPTLGPLAVSVPGCVDGWFELHGKFGSMKMSEILEPAIDYAENGFPVSEIVAYGIARNARVLQRYPGFKELWMADGTTPKKGEIWKNPDLANTLSIIAEKGRDGFYRGKVAQTIADFMEENGGFLSEKDLRNHKSEWVEPVSTNYRGYDVWELPPNGQGIAALQILNILENFDLQSMGLGSAEYLHHLIEAKKLAFEDRAKFYADPDFNEIPVEWLISKEYGKERSELLNKRRAAPSYEPGKLKDGDTIYLTVADKDGNMVSLIQSNYSGMGSGMTPPGLGFILQNRGALFNLNEDHFNSYEPGKRPFHTIIPAFVTKDGAPFMSFGLMGGSMQPQGHAQIVINMVDFGLNLQEAGDAPRVNHAGSSQPTGSEMENGGVVQLESGFDLEVLEELSQRGHKLRMAVSPLYFGGYQAIMLKDGVYYGASESRKDGQAAGY